MHSSSLNSLRFAALLSGLVAMAYTFSEVIECKISAKRMWFGAFKDAHNCMPKAWPDKVAAVEYAEGPVAEPGCVRTMKFHKGG